jgi:hypothetical protein
VQHRGGEAAGQMEEMEQSSKAAEQQEQTDRAEQFVLNEDVRTKLRHS